MNSIKPFSLIGAFCGSLLAGVAGIPEAASAQSLRALNPCPGIFYQEPWNSRVLVPQGCSPNAFTQQMGIGISQPALPLNNNVPTTTQPPLPENQASPMAILQPTNGMVNVKLMNETNAVVSYQAIGHTGDRALAGGQEYTMLNLPLPVTITTVREDDGLLDVTTRVSEAGTLEVILEEEPNLGGSNNSVRIQQDGQVFVY